MLLVIGITGHTGKYFLKKLIENKYDKKIKFFIRKKDDEKLFIDSGLDYEIVYGDLEDVNSIENACENVTEIFEIFNIRYSINILNAAINKKIKRIYFIHTTGIFSKYKMASKEYKNIEENIKNKAKENNIDITILRPTMIYGDLCDHNISKFIKMMDKMRIYPLIAGGKAKIQPVNARDLGDAYYKVLINEELTKNKDYNLSGKDEISIKDMLKLILKNLSKKSIFIPIPMFLSISLGYIIKGVTFGKINMVEKILRMDENRVFDNSEAKKDFDYNPINFEEGLKIEVEEYLSK